MFNAKMNVLAKDIDKPFTHVAIYAALDGIINRRDAPFHLKKNIEEPLGIGLEISPMCNEHVVAY